MMLGVIWRLSFVLSFDLNGDWFWRPARFDALVDIQARLPEISFGSHDRPFWTASRTGT